MAWFFRGFAALALVGCAGSSGGIGSTPDDGGAPPLSDGSSGISETPPLDGSTDSPTSPLGSDDAGSPPVTDAAPQTSAIAHVVILVQENHTFDAYFGRYCTAPTGSAPSCTTGPECCEAAPTTAGTDAGATALTDVENASYDPNHTQACELGEMNDGGMNLYAAGTSCSDARNFALADDTTVKPYRDLAAKYALADRYFQPIVGQSSSNDMYLATAGYVFTDNAYEPDSNGHGCSLTRTTITYTGKTTIADAILASGHTFAYYAEGYAAMKAATFCPTPPADCALHAPTSPCVYDPGDVPFEYYAQFQDNPLYMKDYGDLATDLAAGTLPDVVFVKPVQYHDEHPGYGTTISAGVTFMGNVIDSILGSSYGSSTLILLTWDEGGGFFDHVTPPGVSPVDDQPYGTRIPLLAIGPFAKTNHVSHVTLEHSSIVKFLEWNFTGTTGQLGARDGVVANLGDLLDPAKTGLPVPSN